MPLTAADRVLLEQALGQGPVRATVDCDGECHLAATAVPGVWWVRYFDGEGRELLTTLEVGLVPSLACAAPEEVAASRAELEQYLRQGDAPGAAQT
jgi:hydrogenase-1 operon protein HyaF